jgi:leucyl-tRNA synthetase
MTPIDIHAIEARWRERWQAARLYEMDMDGAARPFYNLMEFPYPSGEGLHMGHVYTYCGADTLGRLKRMQGYDVFQPMGFDAFGIHSENYAMKVGRHPADLIPHNIRRFREQLQWLGCGFDWSRQVDTTDPQYYRWTQWLFVQLFKAGLAYQAEAPVNWCPRDQTVLANEQVVDGRCERCDTLVEQRVLKQWFLRITAYADRLLDVSGIDVPASWVKRQRAWIGRQEADGQVSYRLHDWLISRQRYWGPPIPIVYCERCGTLPVPEEQLPVVLPRIEAFRPTGSAPLAAVEAFVHTTCPACGGPARRETDVSDVFLDSAWYFLRYPSAEFHDRPWDAARTAKWLPVDFYAGGPEHATMHHLYARFVMMALHDMGHVPVSEPFRRLRMHGTITRDGAKMSKSRGNVVSPDRYLAEYGADITRMAMLFAGPWEEGGDFSDAGVSGIARFVARAWEVVGGRRRGDEEEDVSGSPFLPFSSSPLLVTEAGRVLARTVARVTAGIEGLRFHTAISALIEALNWLREHGAGLDEATYERYARTWTLLFAPLAPHLAEELWHELGGSFSVHTQPWPEVEAVPEQAATIELAVQVDGRMRDRISVPADAAEQDVVRAALASARVQAALGGAEPSRVVVVPGRLVSMAR